MDIISAYQQVGSYRGAAELCGTTHRTVKRVVEKFEAGDAAPPRAERVTMKKEAMWYPYSRRKGKIVTAAGRFLSARDWRRRLGEHGQAQAQGPQGQVAQSRLGNTQQYRRP